MNKEMEVEEKSNLKQTLKNQMNDEQQYEDFLRDIEEDKEMRKAVNMYKADEALKELEGKLKTMKIDDEKLYDEEIHVKVEELLDELTLKDEVEPTNRKESLDAPEPDSEEEVVTSINNNDPKNRVNKKIKHPKQNVITENNKLENEKKEIGKRERTGKKIQDK
jgi:hypothetical protein